MHPYAALTPEVVLDAVSELGLRPDGRLLALSSYENRVYQVWLEDGSTVVAKFYRPGRWSEAQIEEEHAFAQELAEREIPVVAPAYKGKSSGFNYAVYPRRGGRTPELGDPKTLEWIGRFMGRIHAIGATKPFAHREALTPQTFGHDPREYLLSTSFIPADLLEPWKAVTEQALLMVDGCYARAPALSTPSACTATAIPETSCGRTTVRISSTLTTRAWARRCKTCGCCSLAIAPRCRSSCARCSTATSSSPRSTARS